MADRNQYFELLGRIAEVRTTVARLLAQQRPGDHALAAMAGNTLHDLELMLQERNQALSPLPADSGEAQRLALDSNAPSTLGGVPTVSGVRPYDEAVVSERLLAIGDLYYCYQHERLGVFRAVQKLQELFRAGVLRLTDGVGAIELYRFDRKSVLRYTMTQRMQAYRRVFGYTSAAPPPGARPNGEFHGHMEQFATQIAMLFRDRRVAEVFRSSTAQPDASFGSVAAARRAGLDFRANLKQASYGDVNVLSVELMQLLNSAFKILGADDVRRQFGSDGAWDTLEEVLQRYHQETIVASQRSRLAEAGREIIRWLAQPFVLVTGRSEFETLAEAIGEYAEEWVTSAQSLSATGRQTPLYGDNVVPLRTASTAVA